MIRLDRKQCVNLVADMIMMLRNNPIMWEKVKTFVENKTDADIRRSEFLTWMKTNYGKEELWINNSNLPPSDFIWQGWNAALDNEAIKKKKRRK